MTEFDRTGWVKFGPCDLLSDWVAHAAPVAQTLINDAAHIDDWLRCGGTWFAGVNLLPNDTEGRVADGPALRGAARDFIRARYGALPLDRAQLSVVYPGYPKPMPSESGPAFGYRLKRDAAHVDGLLPIGPQRRRHLREPHAWVLGIPLNASDASPLVIWEGSHDIMRQCFASHLADIDPASWGDVDLTEIYHAARARCFETCPRVELRARPGESYLIHRFALHGVAPWADDLAVHARQIAYFRPEWPKGRLGTLFATI